MIPGGVDDRDALIAEPGGLLEQKALRRKRQALAVEEVTCNEKRVYVFAYGKVDRAAERLPRGVAQASPDRLRATRERGVEMNIGDMHETHVAN